MTHVAEHYQPPGWFTTNVFNRVAAVLTRLGVTVYRSCAPKLARLLPLSVTAAVGLGATSVSSATRPSPRCQAAPGGGLTLTNVAAAGGVMEVVGANGLAAASRDLVRWSVQSTGVTHNLRGIAWSGGRWVAVGDGGTIVYRMQGRWDSVTGLPNSGLRAIAARPGLLAAGGSGGVVLTSRDGVSWTAEHSGTTGLLWGGTRVGDQLVLSGQYATVIATRDGVIWTAVPTAPRPTGNSIAPRPLLWQLAADGRQVVAVGDFGAILQGGLRSGLRGVHSPTPEILRGVVHARDGWVAVGSGGTIVTSRDGKHWNVARAPTTVDLRGVAFTGGRYVAVGDEGTVISSPDGRRWQIDETAMPCALLGLARGAGRLVAVGGSGRIQISSEGRKWTPVPSPTSQDLYAVTHGPSNFVAVGARGTVLTSPNGRTWKLRSAPTRLNLHAVMWTGAGYLAGGDRGVLLASSDGRHWHRIRFPGFHSIRSFASGERAVIAAGAGTVARYVPGGSWQLEAVGLGHFQTGVAYGDGHFVVVGHNGTVFTSFDDGVSWSAEQSGVSQNLDAVLWTGTRFIATGEGFAISSSDGVSWRRLAIPTGRSVRALAQLGRTTVGVGDLDTRVRSGG
jgi:hypothetical protein